MEKIDSLVGLVNWFEGLSDGTIEPFMREYGICAQMEIVYRDCMADDFMKYCQSSIDINKIYRSWDKFSGSTYYPVPVPESEYGYYCPDTIFDYYFEMEFDMWEGDYGNLRKELCSHIANELKKLALSE